MTGAEKKARGGGGWHVPPFGPSVAMPLNVAMRQFIVMIVGVLIFTGDSITCAVVVSEERKYLVEYQVAVTLMIYTRYSHLE